VTGTGPGTFERVYARYQKREEMTPLSTVEGDRGDAHSEYFTALSERGAIGLLTLFGLFVTVLGTGLRIARREGVSNQGALALGLTLAIIAFAVTSMFNSYLEIHKVAPIFWWIAGGLVVLDRRTQGEGTDC